LVQPEKHENQARKLIAKPRPRTSKPVRPWSAKNGRNSAYNHVSKENRPEGPATLSTKDHQLLQKKASSDAFFEDESSGFHQFLIQKSKGYSNMIGSVF